MRRDIDRGKEAYNDDFDQVGHPNGWKHGWMAGWAW
jgi:hypothetical protein